MAKPSKLLFLFSRKNLNSQRSTPPQLHFVLAIIVFQIVASLEYLFFMFNIKITFFLFQLIEMYIQMSAIMEVLGVEHQYLLDQSSLST